MPAPTTPPSDDRPEDDVEVPPPTPPDEPKPEPVRDPPADEVPKGPYIAS